MCFKVRRDSFLYCASLNKYGSTTVPVVKHHVLPKKNKNEFPPNLYLNLHGTHFPKIARMSLHLLFFLNRALTLHPDSHVGTAPYRQMTVFNYRLNKYRDMKGKSFQLCGHQAWSPTPSYRIRRSGSTIAATGLCAEPSRSHQKKMNPFHNERYWVN